LPPLLNEGLANKNWDAKKNVILLSSDARPEGFPHITTCLLIYTHVITWKKLTSSIWGRTRGLSIIYNLYFY
jgi:hypothetical protein